MSFQNLSAIAQNIEIFTYEQNSKVLILFMIFTFSFIYLSFWKKYVEEETPFFSMMFLRFFLTLFSVINLVLIPLYFLYLSPEHNVWNGLALIFFTIIYSIGGVIFLFLLVLDILYFGVHTVLRICKIRFDDERVGKAMRILFKGKIK